MENCTSIDSQNPMQGNMRDGITLLCKRYEIEPNDVLDAVAALSDVESLLDDTYQIEDLDNRFIYRIEKNGKQFTVIDLFPIHFGVTGLHIQQYR